MFDLGRSSKHHECNTYTWSCALGWRDGNGQSIELQSDYNGPAMDSSGSRMELGAQFLSVPCTVGTKFLLGMRVLREHTK